MISTHRWSLVVGIVALAGALIGVRPTGQVLALRKTGLDAKPLTGLPTMRTTRTTGMLDLALHPKFAENKWIYFTYHKPLDERRESILQDLHQRIRDVRQGPDGLIYVLTEEDDGAVIRIEPAP